MIFSIVIPNWNGKKYLKGCLTSVYNQICKDFEVFVVDNGSNDGSVEYVKTTFPHVIVVEFNENNGFCKAVNKGIKDAKGKYIALLNNDVEVDANWVVEMKSVLDKRLDVGFCASKILFWDERDVVDTCGDGYTVAGFGYKRGYRQKDSYVISKERYVFGACAGAAVYRKQLFVDAGFFDEDFFIFSEDVDMNFRAQLMGFKCLYVPKAIVYHHVRSTAKQDSNLSLYFGYKNATTTLIKNMPGPLLLIYSVDILLYYLFIFLIYGYKRQLMPVLKGQIHAFVNLPITFRKRREIQKQRKVSTTYINSIIDRNWIKIMLNLSSLMKKFK